MISRRSYTGEDGFDVWATPDRNRDVFQRLVEAGALPAGEVTLDRLRIESGIPRYGTDIDDRVVPLEGGIRDTVDFAKGCFIGQEVLGKMQNIGKPRRFLVGLFAEGIVDPETELVSDGKVVGSVKSGVESIALERVISLASVRRGFEEAGTTIDVASGGQVEVTALPFVMGKSITISDLNLST
jgi:aminomethyltransferase